MRLKATGFAEMYEKGQNFVESGKKVEEGYEGIQANFWRDLF